MMNLAIRHSPLKQLKRYHRQAVTRGLKVKCDRTHPCGPWVKCKIGGSCYYPESSAISGQWRQCWRSVGFESSRNHLDPMLSLPRGIYWGMNLFRYQGQRTVSTHLSLSTMVSLLKPSLGRASLPTSFCQQNRTPSLRLRIAKRIRKHGTSTRAIGRRR